ncbi:hypothetical protein [Rhodococcus triatomae]
MRGFAMAVGLAAVGAVLGLRWAGRDTCHRNGFGAGTDDFGYDPDLDPE